MKVTNNFKGITDEDRIIIIAYALKFETFYKKAKLILRADTESPDFCKKCLTNHTTTECVIQKA